jgi:hypothetical protein
MQSTLKEATMFRHACRFVVFAATLGATLVLAGTALANPTRPTILTPNTPSVLEGNVTVSWTPSTFDAGVGSGAWYELEVRDVSAGEPGTLVSDGGELAPRTSTTIAVTAPSTYRICMIAHEVLLGMERTSLDGDHPEPPDCRMFTAFQTPLQPWEIYYLPWQTFKLPAPVCYCWHSHPKFNDEQPDPKTLATIEAAKGYAGVNVLGGQVYPTGDVKLILDR